MTVPTKKLRVIVFVSSLTAGGAERVAVRLCHWLRDAGHEVCLLTLSGHDSDFYSCPDGVHRIALDLQRHSRGVLHAFWSNIRRMHALRRSVRSHRADVVITLGARSNVLMLLALAGVRCRKIISERSDPLRDPLPKGWDFLRRLTYSRASLHVAQSNYVSQWVQRHFPKLRCEVIGNAADQKQAARDGSVPNLCNPTQPIRLVAAGRMHFVKGHDLLIDAFSIAKKSIKLPIRLSLIGIGDRENDLKNQVNKLKLNKYVTFEGVVTDLSERLKEFDIFVLPSRLEGFPNVLIEAMTAGLPVIAARCQGGVEDVLGDVPGQFALEFEPNDVPGLANSIVLMVNSPELRLRLRDAAIKRAAYYSPERIIDKWLRAVEGC